MRFAAARVATATTTVIGRREKESGAIVLINESARMAGIALGETVRDAGWHREPSEFKN